MDSVRDIILPDFRVRGGSKMLLYAMPREKATPGRIIEIMGMSWLSVEEREAEVWKLEF